MSQKNSELWNEVRHARDRLVEQYLGNPVVNLIDIGLIQEDDSTKEEIVLRIHVQERWFNMEPEDRIAFPEEIDGIPIIVIHGNYRIES